MRAKFRVWGNEQGTHVKNFLVQNQVAGPSFNIGINTDSFYKNPTGTGLFDIYNGVVPPVLPSSLPVPTPVITSSSGAAVVFLEGADGIALLTEDGIPLEVDT